MRFRSWSADSPKRARADEEQLDKCCARADRTEIGTTRLPEKTFEERPNSMSIWSGNPMAPRLGATPKRHVCGQLLMMYSVFAKSQFVSSTRAVTAFAETCVGSPFG